MLFKKRDTHFNFLDNIYNARMAVGIYRSVQLACIFERCGHMMTESKKV